MSNNEIQQIKTNARQLTVSMQGVQKLAHETIILCAIHCFNNRYDTSGFRILFNSLENVGGSFRLQGLIDYCQEFADIKVEPDKEKGYGFLVKRGDGKRLNTKDQRRKALDAIKATPFFNWLPDEKPLKAPKLNEHWAIVPARGYAAGTITREEIEAEYGEFGWHKVEKLLSDEKVLAWAEKYQRQNPADVRKYVKGMIAA